MDTKNILPLSRFLLPVDDSEPCMRAVNFAGCLADGLGDRVEKITLLHVFGGGYFSEHMSNIDFRAAEIIESSQFAIIKQQYIDSTVRPMLDSAEEVLRQTVPDIEVEQLAVDGTPADQIAKISDEGAFSTIIIARSGHGKISTILLGSVTSSLLHRPFHPSIYVVGERIMDGGACLLHKMLVPVDGSSSSMAAVDEAAEIAKSHGEDFKKIILLRIVDIGKYEDKLKEGVKPEEDAERILLEAKKRLLKAGVQKKYIDILAVRGTPADTIVKLAKEQDITIVMMGRTGRSAVKEVLMGSVSNEVIHRCTEPTVAIICK